MQIIYPLIVGFSASMFGFLAPSMLSMTAVRTTIEKGKSAGILFAAGAASIIFVQVLVAVFFAKYLLVNPEVLTGFKKAAIFILLGLSIFFFIEARKEFKAEGKKKDGNNYFFGLVMGSLNQMAIPYYLTMAAFAESKGWLELSNSLPWFYIIGAATGAFTLFFIVLSTTTAIQVFA